jgi:hypothetical protein
MPSPQRVAAQQVEQVTPDKKPESSAGTPETVLKTKLAVHDAMLPDDYSIPTLYPLLHLSLPEQQFWTGSESREWRGGLLPRGDCPLPSAHGSTKLDSKPRPDTVVYTFMQLLRASYHDGDRLQCACPPRDVPGPADKLSLLEKEAETVDNFMLDLREHHLEHGLTRQQLMCCFECDPSVPETHVAVAATAADADAFVKDSESDGESDAAVGGGGAAAGLAQEGSRRVRVSLNKKLIIRAAFLEQCREVVGLNLPDVPCTHEGCGREHTVFTSKGLPNMRLDFFRSPIKNPNNVDSEYDPCCDSD